MTSALRDPLEPIAQAAMAEDWERVIIEAEELLDIVPQQASALLYLANASLELGDTLNAAAAFSDHLSVAQPTPDALSGLAVAQFESCDIAGSTATARHTVRLFPDLAEAHYTLGLCLERTRNGATEAASCFAAARSLDPEAYPWPMDLDDERLEQALLRALRSIPRPLARFWSGVPMRFEDQPSMGELVRGPTPIPPTVAGLYQGRPPEVCGRPLDEAIEERPTALRLFRRNLSRCGDQRRVVDQLSAVLTQEALDWLGLPLDAFEEA